MRSVRAVRAGRAVPAGRPVRAVTGRCPRGEAGMTTAEYAVGTVAACGFSGILYKLLTGDAVQSLLKQLIERALQMAF